MLVNHYLRVKDFRGECTAPRHLGEIELVSIAWGRQGGNQAAGGPTLRLSNATPSGSDGLTLIKRQGGASSIKLMEYCMSGAHFSAALTAEEILPYGRWRPNGSIIMTGVIVNSIQTLGRLSDDVVTVEKIQLQFAKYKTKF